MPETRKSRPPLTADQRRRQIVDLLARHLARLPGAAAPQATPAPPASEADTENPRPHPEIALEVSAH